MKLDSIVKRNEDMNEELRKGLREVTERVTKIEMTLTHQDSRNEDNSPLIFPPDNSFRLFKPTIALGSGVSTGQEEKGSEVNRAANTTEVQPTRFTTNSSNLSTLLGDPDRPKRSVLYRDLVCSVYR